MSVYRPTLPAKAGYVERDGKYFPTEETRRVIDAEATAASVNTVAGIMFVLEAEAENTRLDEQTVIEHAGYFAAWTQDYTGRRGSIVSEDGVLYKALHDVGAGHSGMQPSETPTLWKRIGNPNDEWPEWSQPILGVDDFYRLGDQVSHNGGHWICTQENTPDGNTYEPGVWGWEPAI